MWFQNWYVLTEDSLENSEKQNKENSISIIQK